jgi:hypothetical protein
VFANALPLKKNSKKIKLMFDQVIADGANLFITIVAVLVGFASALGFIDFKKTKKNQEGSH